MTIGLVGEDRRFLDFLAPAMKSIAGGISARIAISWEVNLQGCRPAKLMDVLNRELHVDLVVLGADASVSGVRRPLSYRVKGNRLRHVLGTRAHVVLAVAEPSIEAWILSDLRAFADGLSGALGQRFSRPHTPRAPGTEQEAKYLLGEIVNEVTGGPLARSGFEYADAIVNRMTLLSSPNASLAAWANDFRQSLRGTTAEGS